MLWAAIVAAVSVFATLLVARAALLRDARRRAARTRRVAWARRARWSYLLPPLFLGVGALDWTLWSGMEVAFFLATWALALLAFFALDDDPPGTREARERGVGARRVRRAHGPHPARGGDDGRRLRSRVRRHSTAAGVHRRARPSPSSRGSRFPCVVVLAAPVAREPRSSPGEWSANGAHREARHQQPVPDARRRSSTTTSSTSATSILRNVEYHFADVAALRRHPARRSRPRPSLSQAHAADGAAPLGAGRGLVAARRAQRPGALAERALHDARGRVAPHGRGARASSALVRRDPRASPTFLVGAVLGALLVQLYRRRHAPPRTPPPGFRTAGRSRSSSARSSRPSLSAPARPRRRRRRRARPLPRCTRRRRCATRSGSSAAPPATSATSTSRRGGR